MHQWNEHRSKEDASWFYKHLRLWLFWGACGVCHSKQSLTRNLRFQIARDFDFRRNTFQTHTKEFRSSTGEFRHIQKNSDRPLASSDTHNKIQTHAIKFRQINVHPKYFDHTGAGRPLEKAISLCLRGLKFIVSSTPILRRQLWKAFPWLVESRTNHDVCPARVSEYSFLPCLAVDVHRLGFCATLGLGVSCYAWFAKRPLS